MGWKKETLVTLSILDFIRYLQHILGSSKKCLINNKNAKIYTVQQLFKTDSLGEYFEMVATFQINYEITK